MDHWTTRRFLAVSALLAMSLLYSTSWHAFVRPEPTMTAPFLLRHRDYGIKHEALKGTFLVADRASIREKLDEKHVHYRKDYIRRDAHRVKLSSFFGDGFSYMMMVADLEGVARPFRFRVAVPWLLGSVRAVLGERVGIGDLFFFFNGLVVVTTATWLAHFLSVSLRFSRALSMLGCALFMTMTPLTCTVAYPLLEPATFLVSLALFVFAYRRSALAFALTAALGVLVKEVFLFAALLWPLAALEPGTRDRRRLIEAAMVALVPVVTYVALRRAFDASPLVVGFGSNLAKLSLPRHAVGKLKSVSGVAWLLVSIVCSFGIVWLGLMRLRARLFLRRVVWVVPLVMAAAVLFSGYVTRVLGVLFPVVIPAFLAWLEDAREPGQSAR